MEVKINKISYTCKIGVRAFFEVKTLFVGKENFGFDAMVSLAYAGIKDKGKLTKEQLADYLDEDFAAFTELLGEMNSIKGLMAEAKKPKAK